MSTTSPVPADCCDDAPAAPRAARFAKLSNRLFLWTLNSLWLAVIGLGLARPAPARADIDPPGCTGSGLGISLFTDHTVVTTGDVINYSVLVFNTPFPACDATGITAQLVTPDGRTNIITLRRTSLVPGDSDYYTNVASYTVRSQDIRTGNILRAEASDAGDIHQNTPDSRGGGFQGVDTTVAQPCIAITAQCVGGVGENGAITFTGVVTNCGNTTLSGLIVSSSVNNGSVVVLGPINLATNQSATFSGSWVPLNPCAPSTAVFTATATDTGVDNPVTVTATTSTTCSETLTPGILVTKACPAIPPAPGQLLTYTGVVANSGDVTLTNVVVVSDQPAPNTVVFTAATLAPGAAAPFTASYSAPTNCSSTSTLTASGNSVCGVSVSNSATSTCPILTTPAIGLTQSCATNSPVPGGAAVFNATVQNTGNIGLTNVVVTSASPAPGTVVFHIASLAPGASASFTTTLSVASTNVCGVTSSLTAVASDICSGTTVTQSASSTCEVATHPAIAVTVACPNAPATPGGIITYTGTVKNTGNSVLLNVQVTDAQVTPNPVVLTLASLPPGASANYTAAFQVSGDSCSVTTTVAASGTDSCSAANVSNSASVTCPLTTSPKITVTKTCPNPVAPGGVLTYSGTVANSGDVTLTNVVVVSDQPAANTVVFTAATLAPGAVQSFTGSYTAPTNCASTSTLTASATSICGAPVSNSTTTSCPILILPGISITEICSTNVTVPGGTAIFWALVANTGNITLTNIVITSGTASNAPPFTLPQLAPGVSVFFTPKIPVPAGACSVSDTLIASAKDICSGTVVTNAASATCEVTTLPAIAVTVSCPATEAPTGGTITFAGTVQNTGNTTLLNVRVTDAQVSANPVVLTVASLAPGASANFTASFLAPANSCSVGTTVVAVGSDTCTGASVTNSSSTTCQLLTTPSVAITIVCPPTAPAAGTLLTFTGTVANNGNITLTNVTIVGDHTGAQPITVIPLLPPGVSTNFTASFTVPSSASCSITYAATVTGQDVCNTQTVTATASSTCPLLVKPGINIALFCPSIAPPPGGILHYTGVVTNTGNVTLTNVVVTETQPTAGTIVLTLASLAPGASAPFSGQFQVPLNCCTTAHTAVATAGEVCTGTTVREDATSVCVVTTTPKIAVTKLCPTNSVVPGDQLKFSGTVSNAGDITLINVIVIDSMIGTNAPVLGPITLAPGQSVPYTGSFTVPFDFCGTDTVTASGQDLCIQNVVTSSATTTCPVITTPSIVVTKECPPTPTPRGGLLVYTGTVTNTGNVTLTDIFVVDNYPTNNTPVIGPITLAPGASTNFTGSATAPTDCCQVVDTLTATGKDRCDGTLVSATASQVCYLLTTPAITVTKVCPTGSFPAGSLFSFSGTVSNTGDVALTNIFVYSSQPAPNTVLLGPIDLSPGESEAFSGSYTVGTDSDPSTDIVTATGIDTCQARTVTAKADCHGMLPLANQPVVGPLRAVDGIVTITWSATPGVTYAIQYTMDIAKPVWITLPGTVTASGSSASLTDAVGSTAQRYYRVMIVQ